MAAKCWLNCGLAVNRSRHGWGNLTRGLNPGARTASASDVVVMQELFARTLRWRSGGEINGFHCCHIGAPSGSSREMLRKLNFSQIHVVNAAAETDNTVDLHLLQPGESEEYENLLAEYDDFGVISKTTEVREVGCTGDATLNPSTAKNWWSFGDSIHTALHLPKDFEQLVKMLSEKLGCRLVSQELLLRVLVHRSYYEANMPQSDQRKLLPTVDQLTPSLDLASEITFSECHSQARVHLALLGDAFLNLVTAKSLMLECPFQPTGGDITQRRSHMVCNSNLSRVWSFLGLDDLPLTHPPKPMKRGKDVNADTFEAFVGAVMTEQGLDRAEHFVERTVLPLLRAGGKARSPVALLQEQSLTALRSIPDYKVIAIDYKDTPAQVVRVRVYVKGIRLATGLGSSIKAAKLDAANKALLKWPERFEQLSRL